MNDMAHSAAAPVAAYDHGIPFSEALRIWIKVGLLSFGGQAGRLQGTDQQDRRDSPVNACPMPHIDASRLHPRG